MNISLRFQDTDTGKLKNMFDDSHRKKNIFYKILQYLS